MAIDGLRFDVVQRTYGPRDDCDKPFEKLKSVDGSTIPPCHRELDQHVRRSAFVARMWGKANGPVIDKAPTYDDGWETIDDKYKIVWFVGEQLPEELVPNVNAPQVNGDDDDDGNDKDESTDPSDTDSEFSDSDTDEN